MADEQNIKDVASAVVDDVINGVTTELSRVKGTKTCTGTSKERSLLCVLFDPRKYLLLQLIATYCLLFKNEKWGVCILIM